jgi:TRAP-type C4-dicarboxylate transport system substrate-binding protein
MGKKRLQQSVIDPSLSIKAVTKGSVWAISENDVIRMWKEATRDAEVKKNVNHYLDIFKSAFIIEEIKEDVTLVRKSYEQRGYKMAQIMFDETMLFTWAVKKKPIIHVTDLTYENIRYISTTELIEVLNRNFGGGWDSLSRSIQNIILSNFDVSTITLQKDRLHKEGGFYEKKVKDGFTVLEIPKSGWVEAVFIKEKQEQE